MENTKTVYEEKLLCREVYNGWFVYYFFNDDNVIDYVIDFKWIITSTRNHIEAWAKTLGTKEIHVREVIYHQIKVGMTYQEFVDRIFLEEKRWKKFREDENARKIEEARKDEERRLAKEAEEERKRQKAKEKKEAEEKRKEERRIFQNKAENKSLLIEDLVGKCRFEYNLVESGKKENKVLDNIKVNFLICDTYTFEDMKKLQKEILEEVAKRLNEAKRFKKYDLPIGCFRAKMFF